MRALLALLCFIPAIARADATLTVLAAASLKRPLEAGAHAFEQAHPGVKILVSAAATGVLARQVEAGAPADVFIGAAKEPVEALHAQKLVGAPRVIARNQLVVAAPASSGTQLSALDGLRDPSFARIALGKPKVVPAGDYASQALARAGLEDALRERFVYADNVTQVLSYLRSGDATAGFVYASDAKSTSEVRVLLRVDAKLHAPIVYPAAILERTTQRALADAYLEFLAGPAQQAALREAGFLPP